MGPVEDLGLLCCEITFFLSFQTGMALMVWCVRVRCTSRLSEVKARMFVGRLREYELEDVSDPQ
jgi:hypothetical protein